MPSDFCWYCPSIMIFPISLKIQGHWHTICFNCAERLAGIASAAKRPNLASVSDLERLVTLALERDASEGQ